MKIEAVGYCRYSSHNQDEGNSIEAQQLAIQRYAKANDIVIKMWYIDKAFTGRNDKRPEYQRMMNNVINDKLGKAELVIAHKIDRIARNLNVFMSFLATLQKHSIDFAVANIELKKSAEGKMMMQMLAVFAEFYSNNLSNEVKKTMTIIAKDGRHMGGKPLYGYSVNKYKKYEIVEKEAEDVRTIFQMYVDNCSLDEILKELKKRGSKTRKGNDFGKNSLIDLIANEKYIGTFIYNKNSRNQKDGSVDRRKLNSENEIIRVENIIPPILERELFDKAQQKRNKNKKGVRQRASKRTYLLTGKLFCAECGHTMTGNVHINRNKNNGNVYEHQTYRCNNQQKVKKCCNKEIDGLKLESFVIDILKNKLFDKNLANNLYNEFKALLEKEETSDQIKISNLKKELSGKKTEKENLMSLLDSGRLTDEIFDRIEQKNLEIKDIESKIEHAESNIKELITIKEFKKLVKKANSLLNTSNTTYVRELIDNYIEKIVVSNEDITVYFGYQRFVFKIGAGDENRTHVVSLEG